MIILLFKMILSSILNFIKKQENNLYTHTHTHTLTYIHIKIYIKDIAILKNSRKFLVASAATLYPRCIEIGGYDASSVLFRYTHTSHDVQIK